MKARFRAAAAACAFAAAFAATAAEKIHELKPTVATVHRGYFDAKQ
jgi:hypothetical protein